jgi:hypothetical protein
MNSPAPHRTDNAIRLVVVTNSEQLLHAYAVRSICFMEETGLAAKRAFDGNDFQATHIVAYADEEPIGATRIRWFNGFAKIVSWLSTSETAGSVWHGVLRGIVLGFFLQGLRGAYGDCRGAGRRRPFG